MAAYSRFVLSVFLAALFTWPVFSATPSTQIVLEIGDDFILKASGAIRAAKSEVVTIAPAAAGAVIMAKQTGQTQVRIGSKVWEIQVLTERKMKTYRFLKKWTQSRLGLGIEILQGQVVLTGELLRAKDWLGIYAECAYCQFQNQLKMASKLESESIEKIAKILAQKALPAPSIRWNPQAQWIVSNKKTAQELTELSYRLGLTIEVSPDAVEVAPIVRTQIYILEVRREKARQWGLEWPESIAARVIPRPELILDQLLLSAHALEQSGEAKVLANPALLSRSGEEAEFLAGGEFPIKVISRNNSQVIWRKYGIQVKVKPHLDRFGKIRMRLETEVSNIDAARTVDGIPGLLTHRVLSHFDLAQSRLIAISGLIKNDESQAMKGIPGLSQIPILGSLFSSQEFRENRTELVILVKPEPVHFQTQNGAQYE